MSGARGLFLTFEGGEGSGKSTQAQLLKARLEQHGRRVLQAREPGGTRLGEELRSVLLNRGSIDPMAELLLFLAARAEIVAKVIRPALEGGIDVICDRFMDSTAAYQGYGLGLDLELIDHLNAAVVGDCRPDLTVLLDIAPDAGLGRASAGSSGDAIEGHWQAGLPDTPSSGRRRGGRSRSFHQKVRRGYLALARREPQRWLVLDAAQPPGTLGEAVWERVQESLI